MTASWSTRRLGGAAGSDAPGLTVHELESGAPGPVVLVLGGVHGNEIGGILAAGRLVGADLGLRTGRLLVAPVAHEAAHDADARESPVDGLNLARVFPGSRSGSATEVVAALIAEELIAVADVLLDLHTSSPETDMPLFCGCLDDGSAASARAVELALAFGAPVVWTHGALGPGRTLGVARDRGIPALYAESPRGGVLDEAYLDAYDRGVRGVLAALGMTDAAVPAAPPPLRLHGDGDVDAFAHAAHDGLFRAEVGLLDRVERGTTVGVVTDRLGRVLERVVAADSGYVATLRRHARVTAGTPLVGIVPERSDAGGRS